MKPFAFRLDKVLDLRASEEKEEARALGDAHRRADVERETCEERTAHRDTASAQLARQQEDGMPAGTLRNLVMARDAAVEKADAAQTALDAAVRRVEEQRQRLTTARGERRVMERLRSRRLTAWLREVRRAEQRGHDEVAARQKRDGT